MAKRMSNTVLHPRKDATKKVAVPRKVVPDKIPKASAPTADHGAPSGQALASKAPPRVAKGEAAVKRDKPRKPKMVRDSFTFPKEEYAALGVLKERAVKLNVPSKKSELMRGGLLALVAMSDEGLRGLMSAVPTLKTGRPSKT